jgi:hypothetical protein
VDGVEVGRGPNGGWTLTDTWLVKSKVMIVVLTSGSSLIRIYIQMLEPGSFARVYSV